MAAATKRGLGKGLDALFADSENVSGEQASEVSVNDITPDRDQPRTDFSEDAIKELADSISEHGVLQPILVRPIPEGGYRIVAGERRYRAARLAGLSSVPVIVRGFTDSEAMEVALIENLQRQDLNPVEEALGFRRLIDETGITQEEAAKRVGKSRPAVANSLRLLALPADVLEMLKKGQLTTGHAKAILSLEDEAAMSDAAKQIRAGDLTVRAAEKLCASPVKKKKAAPAPVVKDAAAREVELALKDALGVEVRVKYQDGTGTLAVDFYSKDQLFDFANRLGKAPKAAKPKS